MGDFHHNFTTETDVCIRNFGEYDVGSRDDLHSVKTFRNTTRVGLENIDFIHVAIRSSSRMLYERTAGSTPDRIVLTRCCIVFRPSVGQHFIVVVNKVSGKDNLATSADGVMVSSNLNLDGVINIDTVRFAHNCATSSIGDSNREDIRLVSGSSSIDNCIMCSGSRTDGFVEESPFVVVSHTVNSIIDISSQHDDTVFANNLVTRNLDSRVREDIECVSLHFRDTTAVFLRNNHTIDIDCGVAISGDGCLAED